MSTSTRKSSTRPGVCPKPSASITRLSKRLPISWMRSSRACLKKRSHCLRRDSMLKNGRLLTTLTLREQLIATTPTDTCCQSSLSGWRSWRTRSSTLPSSFSRKLDASSRTISSCRSLDYRKCYRVSSNDSEMSVNRNIKCEYWFIKFEF